MPSAYSQAEYLASLPRQVEIPPTTPEHYITGLYALNLAAPEGTSGDWHDVFHWQDGTEQPRQVTLAGMGDIETTSIYGDLGIYEGRDRLASIFLWLVEWGLVAALPVSWLGLCRLGVTACRVSSRGGRAFPGAGGFFLQGRGGQEAGAVCLTEPVGPESCSVRSAGGR